MKILITGASSGIGKQLAHDYLADGHRVWCCGRNEQALAELLREFPGSARTLTFDTQDRAACRKALAETGRLDLAILNAGTCEYMDARRFDGALFQRVMNINVIGTGNCLEAIMPNLADGSTLALMGSSSSFLPLPRAEAYGASKAAIEYLARTLAISLAGAGIHVSYIAPGFVETPLTELNDFPMPMRMDVRVASGRIRQGLARRRRLIHFPRLFTGILRGIGRLPLSWQSRLIARALRA